MRPSEHEGRLNRWAGLFAAHPEALLLLSAIPPVTACVRAGFGISEDREDGALAADAIVELDSRRLDVLRAPELSARDTPGGADAGAPSLITAANDDCAGQATVVFGAGGVELIANSAAAHSDYGLSCCGTLPELVVHAVGFEGTYDIDCAGGGEVGVQADAFCPPFEPFPSCPNSAQLMACDGTGSQASSITINALDVYIFICRAAQQEPVLVTFTPK